MANEIPVIPPDMRKVYRRLQRKRYARYRCLWRCRRDFLPVITGRDTTTLA